MIKTKFQETLANVELRREMYLYKNSYTSLANFFIGYFIGLQAQTNVNFSSKFQLWLKIFLDKKFALHWSAYILEIMAENDEEMACEILFELLKKFANSGEI